MRRALPVLASFLAACAAETAPRSTVQADAIAKSDLDGTWYFRQTVVAAPFTTGFTFIGEQGENELEKIRWDIQEDLLVARRATEFVRFSEKDEPSNKGPAGYFGAPVAAFAIKAQFDIAREYNPSTGEEFDKIVENTERKWFDRKFIRVDWSKNLITNFEFLADFGGSEVRSIKQDPAPYYVSDPKDPDAFRLERQSPTAAADYMEVTQKIIASPESVDFEDWGNVPLCWLEYATQDCASQEIRIRNSFLRAAPRDYDPLVYDDHMMERFGYFTTDRASYNRQYGETESGRVRLVNRFNIWQHNLADKTCTKDSDCGETRGGVHCVREVPDATVDVATGTITGRCTLPYSSRNLADPKNQGSKDLGPRTIVYYLNDSFPASLVDAAKVMADEYDSTYKETYQALLGKPSPGRIFTLCTHNPVVDGDPAECGKAGTHARIGDLRYNMIYWVDEPTSAQLLGYGPSSHDPETGETIEGTAFIYGAEVDSYSAQARDIVRLVNGEIAPDKFIDGENVSAWVNANGPGARRKTASQADVDAAAKGMDLSWTKALPRTSAIRKGNTKKMHEALRTRSRALAQSPLLGADPGLSSRRLARIAGTDLERQLSVGEILLARGMDPRTSSASLNLDKVRALSFLNPETTRAMKRERRRLGAHAVDVASTFDDTAVGFALSQKGKDPMEVWRRVREANFRSTAEHELGHTLGLRHNFSGSYDAMNYPSEYWKLRTSNGTKDPKPRYLEAESQAELEGITTPFGLKAGISEFQTSSIMDYGAKFNTDINGIGRYDRAAIKFGYGQVVEVFNNTKDPYLLGALQATVTYGSPQEILGDCSADNWTSVHYTKYPKLVDLDDRSNVEFSSLTHKIVAPACEYPDSVETDPAGHIVVPYRFCSDEFEGASSDCQAFDRGPDMYEVAQNAIDTYRNYYLFNNFKRDRLGFSPDSYLDRIYERYLDPLRTQMQFYVLLRADYADFIDADDPFWTAVDGWGTYTMAVKNGFDLLGEIITTPEPGPYVLYELDDGREGYLTDEENPAFSLDLPLAKYQETSWEYDSGYYWYERVQHVGTFVDKVAALAQLTDPETSFIGKDEASDLRQYAINYWRLYPSQMTNLWGAAMSDRWDLYAPVWGNGKYTPRPISEPIPAVGADEAPVDPKVGFSVQAWAATLGVALIPATFDQTFANSAKIWIKTGARPEPALPTVHFDDPMSGNVYMAISYKKGAVENGIGARMIARATELAALDNPTTPATRAALVSYLGVLESMRTVSAAYDDEMR